MQKLERLRRSLHFIGAPQQSKHTVFLEGEEASSFSPQQHFNTPAELLGRAYNRPRNEQLASAPLAGSATAQLPDSKRLDRFVLSLACSGAQTCASLSDANLAGWVPAQMFWDVQEKGSCV